MTEKKLEPRPCPKPEQINAMRERWKSCNGMRVSTHWEGCADEHPWCAAVIALDSLEAANAKVERLKALCAQGAEALRIGNDALASEMRGRESLVNTVRMLTSENESLRARVERLVEAGDGVANWARHNGLDAAHHTVCAWWAVSRSEGKEAGA